MKNLSSILSQLMTEKGIKSSELARKTGVGQPVIYRIMTGVTDNPQIHTLMPIADFFKVSIDQLLGIKPLQTEKILNNISLHDINNKLTAIKTIAAVFLDLLPSLIEGYQLASTSNLIKQTIPYEILPLLPLNCSNLLKSINQLQEILSSNDK